jgi:hypothetical protein
MLADNSKNSSYAEVVIIHLQKWHKFSQYRNRFTHLLSDDSGGTSLMLRMAKNERIEVSRLGLMGAAASRSHFSTEITKGEMAIIYCRAFFC